MQNNDNVDNNDTDTPLMNIKIKLKDKYPCLGYPLNVGYDYTKLKDFINITLNNVGDPFSESSIKCNTKSIECEVLHFFANLWNINPNNIWGYITNSGTEGNLQGLYVGRESAKQIPHVFLTSKDSHFSIFKIAKILQLNLILVESQENGEIDYSDFNKKIMENKNCYIIVNANLGTTMKGGIDNTQELYRIIKKHKVQYYMHVDGALSGFYLPFLEKDLFFKSYINSMSISGHKFLGIPFPCGIFIMEKKFMDLVSNESEYIGTKDYMISCSRNGHSSLFFKHIIDTKTIEGFKQDIDQCIQLSDYVTSQIEGSWRNRNSITVVFPKPNQYIIKKWQLAIEGNIAHILIMPYVTKQILDEFIYDYNNQLC
jgi:histidine decarboxylase